MLLPHAFADRYFAVWSVCLGTWHGLLHRRSKAESFLVMQVLSGYVLIGFMGALLLAFIPPLRRRMWELFYRVHCMLALAVAVLITIHGGIYTWCGIGAWVFDVIFRYFYVTARNPTAATLVKLPAGVTKVSIKQNENFSFRPGQVRRLDCAAEQKILLRLLTTMMSASENMQYVFLCVPSISMFEWHPFSISSSPAQSKETRSIELHVRSVGTWTRWLEIFASLHGTIIDVMIDGPYGEVKVGCKYCVASSLCLVTMRPFSVCAQPQIDIESQKYSMFLLISGGIGVTPMQSLYNQLFNEHKRGRPLDLVWFVWSCRDQAFGHHFAQNLTDEAENANETIDAHSSESDCDSAKVDSMEQVSSLPICFQPCLLSEFSTSQRVSQLMAAEPEQPSEASSKVPTTGEMASLPGENHSSFHTNFYLTRGSKGGTGDVQESAAGTRHRFENGRPNLNRTFLAMAAIAKEKNIPRVAVLTCGPPGLTKDVEAHCLLISALKKVQFDLHVESFEL